MKTLKEYARAIWQPDGTAADIQDAVTDRGFRQLKASRCSSEMVGVHPTGGPGVRWSKALWESTQDWCRSNDNCSGVMLYVGKHDVNCHHWCGRPQFCSGLLPHSVENPHEGAADTLEQSGDWNLFMKLPAGAQ
eukprot:TRINITY_DN49397_c0_g1_i2.p1 TRINITY_DN49397_c0_g1~~TRINITY_DN49397_c0_g1_i2.p1  ORF type:complete len:134 (-),score=12.74 TRINITY_DN49397_c0_g1_i2:447-848(-)